MQQRAGDLALHPLAEREVADRLLEQLGEIEEVDQLVDAPPVIGNGNPVDRPVELERVEHRNVPGQLVPLSHDQGHLPQVRAVAAPRLVAEDIGRPGGGVQQPGQHLQRRRLPGAVRPQEPDDLAGPDLEADVLHRVDILRLAVDQAREGRPHAALALGHDIGLAQVVDGDRRGCPGISHAVLHR